MTPDDIQRVAHIIEERSNPKETSRPFGFRPPTSEGNGKPSGNHQEAKGEVISSPSESIRLDAEQARIIALFQAGKDIADIVREVYGTTGGRAYQERAREVQAVIRRLLRDIP
jgi:predicted metal-dependent enzyme (double-stranded beta helix superfamily)